MEKLDCCTSSLLVHGRIDAGGGRRDLGRRKELRLAGPGDASRHGCGGKAAELMIFPSSSVPSNPI
jgi:hypothetical protein